MLALFAAQFAWRSHVEANWSQTKSERQQDLARTIQSSFDDRLRYQMHQGEEIRLSDEISEAVETRAPGSLAAAFQRLAHYNSEDDLSIDIVDTAGTIILWSGRSVVPSYASILQVLRGDRVAFVSQARLHRYLSVAWNHLENGTLYSWSPSRNHISGLEPLCLEHKPGR